MQLTFAGHGVDITDPLRNLINKKFEKISRHLNNNILGADVILSVQKLNHTAEINLLIKGAEISAKGNDEDMYKAIDQMILKLDTQIIKHKEKTSGHRE